MTKEELKSYLVDEAEYDREKVESMGEYDLIDAWLTYEGIVGFTEDIADTVLHVYEHLDEDMTIWD